MAETSGRERQGVGWNINSKHSELIFGLLIRANKFHLGGMFNDQYFNLRSLRDHINHDLKETERDELDILERNVDRCFSQYKRIQTTELKEAHCQSVRKYLQKIMDTLLKLGYLPKKESKTDVGL